MEGPAAVPMISTMFGLLFHHAPVRNRRVGEYNSNFTKSLGFMVDIELVTKVYKPTYNCGASPCRIMAILWVRTMCVYARFFWKHSDVSFEQVSNSSGATSPMEMLYCFFLTLETSWRRNRSGT